MANDKYNIEIELKAKAEEALKAIDALNDIEKATGNLANKISASEKIIEGSLYHLGGHITNLALNLSFSTSDLFFISPKVFDVCFVDSFKFLIATVCDLVAVIKFLLILESSDADTEAAENV